MEKNAILLSSALVALLKGVVSESKQLKIWNTIIDKQIQISDYFSQIGLNLIVQSQDGYAYLKQKDYEDDEDVIPRIIPRRQLNFMTSLLLVILRKEIIELGKINSDEKYVISQQDIILKIKDFLNDTTDEAKQRREIESTIKKIEEMGFIRTLDNSNMQYEILPLIRSFVDAQWLGDFNTKLDEYNSYINEKGGENNESI